jgi:hypothetical protein
MKIIFLKGEAMETNVIVRELELSDGSKVYDVVLTHYQARLEFELFNETQAGMFSADLLEVFRKHGFLDK